MIGIWLAAVSAALLGIAATPMLVAHGLAQLACQNASSGGLRLVGALGGGAAAVGAFLTSYRTEIWWLAPALLVWGCSLVAAASCDAVTQRIPTPLVRQAGVATCALLIVGSALQEDWSGLVISGIAAVASGLTLLLCWRFAGAGFGDVRLATLGGLGLGHVTHRGLLVGLATFVLITVTQAVITLMRGGNHRTTIPYGPALVIGFLLAASL